MKPAPNRGELALEGRSLDEPPRLGLARPTLDLGALLGACDTLAGEASFDRAVGYVVGSKTGKVPATHRTADHRGPTFGPRGAVLEIRHRPQCATRSSVCLVARSTERRRWRMI